MADSTYQFLIGGMTALPILESTLPKSVSGDSNRITFARAIPDALATEINSGDVYASLGCKDQRGEIIKIVKGSYRSDSRTAIMVRGISRWANNTADVDNIINFFTPNSLFLDFTIIAPALLQRLQDTVNSLSGANNTFFNSQLPAGTTTVKGVYQSAFRQVGIPDNTLQNVVTIDGPAWVSLLQTIFGSTTTSYSNLQLSFSDSTRAGVLRSILDYLQANPTVTANVIIPLLTQLQDPAKFKKLTDILSS